MQDVTWDTTVPIKSPPWEFPTGIDDGTITYLGNGKVAIMADVIMDPDPTLASGANQNGLIDIIKNGGTSLKTTGFCLCGGASSIRIPIWWDGTLAKDDQIDIQITNSDPTFDITVDMGTTVHLYDVPGLTTQHSP